MNNLQQNRNLASIILAAGQGKRMGLTSANKVTVSLVDKPIILRIVHFMQKLMINTVIVVIGFAKESVIKLLEGEPVVFAEQKEQLGTGHAVECALEKIPPEITDVIVVYGDDAVLYTEGQRSIIEKLLTKHLTSSCAFSFLTIEQDNPAGLGRVIRDKTGKILAIIEEKDATEEQKNIHEINPGCFVFRVDFLKKYLSQIEKSPATGEYYLTSLIDLAIRQNEHIETLNGGKLSWRGINTPEELRTAEAMLSLKHE